MSIGEEKQHLLSQASSLVESKEEVETEDNDCFFSSSLPAIGENNHNNKILSNVGNNSNNNNDNSSNALGNMNDDQLLLLKSRQSSLKDKTLRNFILFSILFSINHGAVVSCLSLATARLGNLGTAQNSCLYLSYTLSALFGSTYVIKTIGSYYSIILGMVIYCLYVLSYVIATMVDGNAQWGWLRNFTVISGGLIGGVGGGFLWTAQGTFFASQAEKYGIFKCQISLQDDQLHNEHVGINLNKHENDGNGQDHHHQQVIISQSMSLFAGIFACIYLLVEVVMRLSSSFMINALDCTWSNVFAGYACVTILATLGMFFVVENYGETEIHHDVCTTEELDSELETDIRMHNEGSYIAPSHHALSEEDAVTRRDHLSEIFVENESISEESQRCQEDKESNFYKATITFRLFFVDPKMKYMVPICAVFGLSAVFIITFVNGEVLRISLNDKKSVYVGILSAITSATAGILSIAFGLLSQRFGNGIVLLTGCISFFMVGFLFIAIPDLEQWNLPLLIVIYVCQGVGRSSFEGALKAEFAIIFKEKEGAFGNIIFQNGLVTTIGFYLAAHLYCDNKSSYCVEYSDGSYHNVLTLELLVVGSAVLAAFGYAKAKRMYDLEVKQHSKGTRNFAGIVL